MLFGEALWSSAARSGVTLPPPRVPEALAGLDYVHELDLKQAGLASFWSSNKLPLAAPRIAAAPVPRGYRTTSKRRARLTRKGLALAFAGEEPERPGVSPSRLDAPEHAALYRWLSERLRQRNAAALVETLNWVVVRGRGRGLCLVLNLVAFDGPVVRAAKSLAEALQKADLGVASAFLFLDPSGSDYYLEARRPAGRLALKRLFGPEQLDLEVDGVRLRFPVTVFSQVNEPMLPGLLQAAREQLGELPGRALLDLYCGYGLFGLTIGRTAAAIVGVEVEGPAVAAAAENAHRLAPGGRARFIAGRLTAEFVDQQVRAARHPEVVLLDPPRQGTAPGLVGAVARRQPERVVHVFCGTDELPRELSEWWRAGYEPAAVAVLDLFPGTASLETLVQLQPVGGKKRHSA